MKMPLNGLKDALKQGQCQRGIWLGLASASVAEMAGDAGFDWCLIDAEHCPNDLGPILDQLRALEATRAHAVVRVPSGEDWIIKQVLDLGVQSVLVPMVDTPDEARRVARAMRYPPNGHRGMGAALARASRYNAIADYAAQADAQMCCMVQAETRQAMRNLADIAATPGIDGVFIGPADLSADMGHTGNPGHPDVVQAIAEGIEVIKSAGKAPGIVVFDAASADIYEGLGVTFLGVGSDVTILGDALRGVAG